MFGDNLSFISDTTIAATSTQGCAMKDKFKENFFIALPAALVTVIILLVLAFTGGEVSAYQPAPINLWLLLPYFLVLVGGVIGINVFVVLIAGIVVAFVIKLVISIQAGLGVVAVISAMGSGASGMFEVIIVTLLVSMLSGLMREFVGFDALLYCIKRIFRGRVGG
jgi:Na+/H+ antiporter NhaC